MKTAVSHFTPNLHPRDTVDTTKSQMTGFLKWKVFPKVGASDKKP